MDSYLAIDVGGTKVAVALVSADAEVSGERVVPTAALREHGDPFRELVRIGREVLGEFGTSPVGVGISLPGPTDPDGIRMRSAPTIPEFEGVSLGPLLEDEFGVPAAGDNDANACALAEWRFGAGSGAMSLVYMTISTGIGGGAVLDGRLYRGSHGTAIEIGHQPILVRYGPRCDCGACGCLESLASGRGIARRALAADIPAEYASAEGVLELMRGGNPAAAQVWEETVDYLTMGVATAINLFDPEVVVLGGGVAIGAGADLLEPLQRMVTERAMPVLHRETPIRLAKFGARSALVGAACLAGVG